MFQQSRIQLPTEEQPVNTSPPPFIKRSSSNWSIPCCSTFSIRGQRIQLPDDSDSEEQEEFIINDSHQTPVPAPFTMNFESSNENAFTQRASNLSRNPFARVTEDDRPINKKSVPEEGETLSIEATSREESLQPEHEEENVEELADFTTHSPTANKYANEPDWTEMYQDDEGSIKEGITLDTQHDNPKTLPDSETTKDPSVSSQTSVKEEGNEDEENVSITSTNATVQVEKIPQIDEQVLHLLPLPQLSKEIPPTLIHKKPSFEKSMYGEEPLMSTSSRKEKNRVSRFSMTEEDFIKFKKQEEERTKRNFTTAVDIPREAEKTSIMTVEESNVEEAPIVSIPQKADLKQSEEQPDVTQQQQRRSSIVATAAQSILGDKLDDFTEKLAFIKKNIIMSIDSDEDDEDIEEADNAETTLKKIAQMKGEQAMNNATAAKVNDQAASATARPLNHRRSSSLMDVAPTIARFMHQISGTASATNDEKRQVSPTATTSTSFSPSSLFSALAGPEPSSSTTIKPAQTKVSDQEEDELEELFDFTKVIEIGKNVKSFSEGFVGNSIRMFNDVATRMKNSAEEEEKLRNSSRKSTSEDDNDDHSNWLNDSYI